MIEARWPAVMALPLMPAERIMLGVTVALLGMGLVLVGVRGYAIDWPSYLALIMVGGAFIGLGLFYRISNRSNEIATTLIGTGAYAQFSAVATAFNYLLLPIWRTPIDPALAAIDAAFGFHWPEMLEFAARWPLLTEATRYAYMSSIFQFAAIVLLLGLGGRTSDLQLFMVATTLASLATVGFWALLPSLGTTTLYAIAPEIELQVQPLLGTDYGQNMLRLAASGPSLITPKDIVGLISAPSFHTVMALLAVHSVRNVRWAFWPLLAVNILVVIGAIIHGAHHLVDVAGGVVTTVLAVALARTLLVPVQPVAPAMAAR